MQKSTLLDRTAPNNMIVILEVELLNRFHRWWNRQEFHNSNHPTTIVGLLIENVIDFADAQIVNGLWVLVL